MKPDTRKVQPSLSILREYIFFFTSQTMDFKSSLDFSFFSSLHYLWWRSWDTEKSMISESETVCLKTNFHQCTISRKINSGKCCYGVTIIWHFLISARSTSEVQLASATQSHFERIWRRQHLHFHGRGLTRSLLPWLCLPISRTVQENHLMFLLVSDR